LLAVIRFNFEYDCSILFGEKIKKMPFDTASFKIKAAGKQEEQRFRFAGCLV
jgi:hypothetical protein